MHHFSVDQDEMFFFLKSIILSQEFTRLALLDSLSVKNVSNEQYEEKVHLSCLDHWYPSFPTETSQLLIGWEKSQSE